MSANKAALLERVASLRLQGAFQDAVNTLNELLRQMPADSNVLAQVVMLSLVTGQYETAHQACLQIPKEYRDAVLPAGCLGRFKALFPDAYSEICNSGESPAWLKSYLADGSDPVYAPNITHCGIRCVIESPKYDFTAACESCESEFGFLVEDTFLLDRELLCPNCFARQRVNYDLIKSFFEEKYATPGSECLARLDRDFNNLRVQLSFDALKGEEFPLLCRYLNHDYVVLLNQCVLGELYSGERSAAQ